MYDKKSNIKLNLKNYLFVANYEQYIIIFIVLCFLLSEKIYVIWNYRSFNII